MDNPARRAEGVGVERAGMALDADLAVNLQPGRPQPAEVAKLLEVREAGIPATEQYAPRTGGQSAAPSDDDYIQGYWR